MSDVDKSGWKTPVDEPALTVVPFRAKQAQPKCECEQCARIEKIQLAKTRLNDTLRREILPILDEAISLGVLLEFSLIINGSKYDIGRLSCTEQH